MCFSNTPKITKRQVFIDHLSFPRQPRGIETPHAETIIGTRNILWRARMHCFSKTNPIHQRNNKKWPHQNLYRTRFDLGNDQGVETRSTLEKTNHGHECIQEGAQQQPTSNANGQKDKHPNRHPSCSPTPSFAIFTRAFQQATYLAHLSFKHGLQILLL